MQQRQTWAWVFFLGLLLTSMASFAIEVETTLKDDDVKKYKRTDLALYLTPQEAYDLKASHPEAVLFVDVRTHAEVSFVGSPTVMDANIPLFDIDVSAWDAKERSYDMQRNSDFESQLEQALNDKGLSKDSPVIFMCRSGGRSAAAADVAAKLGLTRAYSITEGFEGDTSKSGSTQGQRTVNGWKNAGLPWHY